MKGERPKTDRATPDRLSIAPLIMCAEDRHITCILTKRMVRSISHPQCQPRGTVEILNTDSARVLHVLAVVAMCACAPKDLPESTSSAPDNDTLSTAVESPRSSQPSLGPSYEAVARRKYGERVEFVFNDSRSYVICIAGEDRFRSPFPKSSPRLTFFVYGLASEQIVFEESIDNASVSWEEDTLVKVSVTPGIVRMEEPTEYGYLYDVVARQKLPLSK